MNAIKGKRTYITIGLMVATGLAAALKVAPVSPEVVGLVETFLGALAAYFRSQA